MLLVRSGKIFSKSQVFIVEHSDRKSHCLASRLTSIYPRPHNTAGTAASHPPCRRKLPPLRVLSHQQAAHLFGVSYLSVKSALILKNRFFKPLR